MKRYEIRAAHAMVVLADIEASVRTLNDEDLLDLADIFAGDTPSPLRAMAVAEMTKRKLSL